MTPSCLTLKAVTVGYDDRVVLENVDLELKPGELLAFAGPNGVGKTTLLKVMDGRSKPQHGTVTLDGKNLSSFSAPQLARRIAFVPQAARVDWPFTVREAVSLGRFPHRGWFAPPRPEDREAVDRSLLRCDLEDFGERLVTELSGGELQRVMIARALAQEPDILLLDEPVSHLDVKHQIATLELVRELADGGMAVAASLHDLNLAGLYADRVALFVKGHLHAVGSPLEILQEPLIRLAFDVPVLVGEHPTVGGVPSVYHPAPNRDPTKRPKRPAQP